MDKDDLPRPTLDGELDPDDRDEACRLHDAIALAGDDEAQALAHDWYQHTASQEPCPVCEVIREHLQAARERSSGVDDAKEGRFDAICDPLRHTDLGKRMR